MLRIIIYDFSPSPLGVRFRICRHDIQKVCDFSLFFSFSFVIFWSLKLWYIYVLVIYVIKRGNYFCLSFEMPTLPILSEVSRCYSWFPVWLLLLHFAVIFPSPLFFVLFLRKLTFANDLLAMFNPCLFTTWLSIFKYIYCMKI